MPATYTVFEAVKERVEELLEGQPDEEQIKELAERLRAAEVDKGVYGKGKLKTHQMKHSQSEVDAGSRLQLLSNQIQ